MAVETLKVDSDGKGTLLGHTIETQNNKNQPNGYAGLDGSGNVVGKWFPRSGGETAMSVLVGDAGEFTLSTDTGTVRIHDGSTPGGRKVSYVRDRVARTLSTLLSGVSAQTITPGAVKGLLTGGGSLTTSMKYIILPPSTADEVLYDVIDDRTTDFSTAVIFHLPRPQFVGQRLEFIVNMPNDAVSSIPTEGGGYGLRGFSVGTINGVAPSAITVGGILPNGLLMDANLSTAIFNGEYGFQQMVARLHLRFEASPKTVGGTAPGANVGWIMTYHPWTLGELAYWQNANDGLESHQNWNIPYPHPASWPEGVVPAGVIATP